MLGHAGGDMNASPEDHARLGGTALLVGFAMATLASCAEAHHGSAADPMTPLPCTYEGQFGQACGGTSPYPRLCGELAVEIEGETHHASVGLDAWSFEVCF
jgi:hypothetical protein